MRLKEYEIVIEPREIVFEHIVPNKVFKKTLNIKNVGNKSRRMELFRPSNKAFKLTYKNPELPVPPGMEIAATVEFQTDHAQEYVDKMVITIDNQEIEIPIQAFPACPIIVVDDAVDLGVHSANNKTISGTLKITNKGAVDAEFSINYKGDLPLTFSPPKGNVPAYTEFYIRVDFFTKSARKIEEKIRLNIKDYKEHKEFKVIANIMKRELVLLDFETQQPIQKIDFGSCYYGCNLTNLVVLYNSSPEKVDFVILLEEKGLGVEIGAELSKSTNALKAKQEDYKEEDFSPLNKLLSAFPNNGTMEPFEKKPIFLRFNPRYKHPDSGFLTTLKQPPRRDYAIFLYFELLGDHQKTELAVTGTALPVLLRIEPNKMDFESCEIGQKKDFEAVLYNESEIKPVKFKFKKIANYIVNPAFGRIPPRSSRNVVVSFIPHQMGTFNSVLNCQVIDKIADFDNPLMITDKGISNIPIEVFGKAIQYTTLPIPKFSKGMDPLITNETGLNVNTTVASLKPFLPKAAIQNSLNDSLHKLSYSEKIKKGKESDYKIAFPNDRAKSLGPFNRKDKFKVPFTGADRYNYIDPDYAYTDEEILKIEKHKEYYKRYIDDLKFYRSEKRRNNEFFQFNNQTANGLIPDGGVKAPDLTLNELALEKSKFSKFNVNSNWKLISSEELSNQEQLLKNSLKDSTNQITKRDKDKVNVQLTPAEIYKIIVSPSALDFGVVCVRSMSAKNLDFLNTLDQPIHVELENDCQELGQTNPLSQIIPPKSKGTFQFIFESDYVQSFQRSISYRINYSYRHHIIILAESKLPSLKLNNNHVVITQLPGIQAELCYRKNVTIINPFNATAEFTWIPIYGEQGTAFSIRPASGFIEPFKELECEIVWHGSFLAPLKGTFSLQVSGGEATTLTCEAKLGTPHLQFINRRANFGRIPVNMTSSKTFYLTNTGTHHGFFQILDPRPIQGMLITPAFGLAPLDGLTPLKVEITPSEIMKFDAKVMIQIRGNKLLELRLSGESEEPLIDISMPSFDFGGVYSGASCAIPFKLTNQSKVKGKIEFDLKRYSDFSIKCSESKKLEVVDKMYYVSMQPDQSVDLELIFSPTEIASYEFELPININKQAQLANPQIRAMSSAAASEASGMTPWKDRYSPSRKSSRSSAINFLPKRIVNAIGLRHAIEITETKIEFQIPIKFLEMLKEGGFFEAKSTVISNKGNRAVKWAIDMRKSNRVLEDGIFKICNGSLVPFVNQDRKSVGPEGELKPNESVEIKIMFCPDKPGLFECNLPVILNNNFEQPYYNIQVLGELVQPIIMFEPEVLILKPVPLGVEVNDQIFIKHRGYETKNNLKLEVLPVKTLNGEELNVIKAQFVNGSLIQPENENGFLEVSLCFSCKKPVSTVVKLKFTDEQNREYFYNVTVTADNSLFTCHAFLADHQTDYQIIVENGHIMKGTRTNTLPSLNGHMSGEPILRPMTSNSKASHSRLVSPTFDLNNVQTQSRDDEMRAFNGIESGLLNMMNDGLNSRLSSLCPKIIESLVLPPADTNSGIFVNEVVKVVQRWFGCNGWPTSHNIVKIPESFRAGVSKKPFDEGQENMPQQDAMKRENKTIYEMLQYLSGKPLPAIPTNVPIPTDINDRTILFHWQHNILLKFIEAQGGCVSHIKPEHLLDLNEYKTWLELNNKSAEENIGFKNTLSVAIETPPIPSQAFNLVSKKAWFDCLMQILKVCVVNRITPKSFKMSPVPYNPEATFPNVNSDSLTSNIYSTGERILLTWLNYCYAHYKDKIWTNAEQGTTAPCRWIVNFDTDLTDSLVIGAVLGAYCPFIIDSYLKRMYLMADTAEKCFHNALILIDCCREIGIDYDINSLDITDPNSISMILFCSFLYHKLPQYIPSSTVDFSGPLHQTVTKQINISNPSGKNIFYEAKIIGPSAENFSLPKGNDLPISAKSRTALCVNFVGYDLKPGNAYLLLVGKKKQSMLADTLVFGLVTNIDELTTKKTLKFASAMYQPTETYIEVENPYDQGGEFKVSIIESNDRSGTIKNPFGRQIDRESFDEKLSEQQVKLSKKSEQANKSPKSEVKTKNSKETQKSSKANEIDQSPLLSAFYTKTKAINLGAKSKAQLIVNYLPLQLIKQSAVIVFSNENIGEFLYYLEGTPSMPGPTKVGVDEQFFDSARVKHIKSNKNENQSLMFRCFSGDKVEVKLLIPVCNFERENAIIMATEMRMNELELNRRKIHGVLSSKSLLEALDNLTLNKVKAAVSKSTLPQKKLINPINYAIEVKNPNQFNVPNNLNLTLDDIQSDENCVPLVIKFNADRPGLYSSTIELKSLPDDIRVIPIDFKVTESAVSDATVAYLKFNSPVFDPIVQPIPIKNNSEVACNYEVEITPKSCEKSIFTGPLKFNVKPKENYTYELVFVPNAEEKFEAELRFNNLTEGIQSRYFLTGFGEKRTPLGEIKFETKVGQITHHEIAIPNKSSKKICFYVSSNNSFIRGPDRIMLLPNQKEMYKFEIAPSQRGEFKGALTFRPGEWPIKDIDSDGEEMAQIFDEEKPPRLTLWYSVDIKVLPQAPQSVIELESHAMDTSILCIPLTNPFEKKMELNVSKNGPYLEGAKKIEIEPNQNLKYELQFKPKQVGKFKGSLIFYNEDIGEFWYELRLTAVDPLPIETEPVEAEVGKYASKTIQLSNPLNETVQFRVLLSNTKNFSLEKKYLERIQLNAKENLNVNILFTPSQIGLADHTCLVAFFNEKIGNITYELRGIGLEPDSQDLISMSSELGQSQMMNVKFRNPTDSAIYCELTLSEENGNHNDLDSFSIPWENIKSIHVAPLTLLEIPIIFTPNELKRYNVRLTVSAKREGRMSWVDKEKVEKLQWVYPIKAFGVINAISKSAPFVLECMVRKRLEKRMEVVLSGVTTIASSFDKSPLKVRSVTPQNASKYNPTTSKDPLDSLVIYSDNPIANDFIQTIEFTGTHDQIETAKNSIAMKMVRLERDKTLVTLIYDFIFCPSKSFINEAFIQIETPFGGMWRYPLRLVALEPPPDDTITIEAFRLYKESIVGFRLCSKSNKSLPFKAHFASGGDQVFTVTPNFGELLPESEEGGTLMQIGFIPNTYGKVFESELIITTPTYQWKYLIKGVTPEYVAPRGHSSIASALSINKYSSILKNRSNNKKRNYVLENTYILQTAVSSPIKGASLVPMKYSNLL